MPWPAFVLDAPAMLPPRGELRARCVSLTEANSVFHTIKEDLAAANLLSPHHARAAILAPVRQMSGPKGAAYPDAEAVPRRDPAAPRKAAT